MIVISFSSLFVRHIAQRFEIKFKTSWRVSNARRTPKVNSQDKRDFVRIFRKGKIASVTINMHLRNVVSLIGARLEGSSRTPGISIC